MQPLSVKAAIKQFLADCAAAYKAPNTLIWYESMLRRLERYCGAHALDQLKSAQLVRYVSAIRAEEDDGLITRRTAHDILRALKTFLKWASAAYDLLDLSSVIKLPPLTRLTSSDESASHLGGAATQTHHGQPPSDESTARIKNHTIKCIECEKTFKSHKRSAKTCSDRCRKRLSRRTK